MKRKIKEKKVAFIGSGISALGSAYFLDDLCDIKIFEKNNKFGGHSNTVQVNIEDKNIYVDTGFIVYNESNYPNLNKLFEILDVPVKWSDMSFGFSNSNGKLEYACDSINKIFSQRSNIIKPSFLKGIVEILRFNKQGLNIDFSNLDDDYTLGTFLKDNKYNEWFKNNFILPMGAAIWSTPVEKMLDFPIKNFLLFFKNHDLLNGLSPSKRWKTVDGGSKIYVEKIIKKIGNRVKSGCKVVNVKRTKNKVRLRFKDGSSEEFDHVIFSTKANEILKILDDPKEEEKEILSHFEVSRNRAVLHSDNTLMPKLKNVWSSWNFISDESKNILDRPSSVTYWMNRLQSIEKKFPLFVSLNPINDPKDNCIFDEFIYYHPMFKSQTFSYQKKLDLIQGRGGIWYSGAWLGYGFHEDGLVSGLRILKTFGYEKEWMTNITSFKNKFIHDGHFHGT